jgi:hypothetical protein
MLASAGSLEMAAGVMVTGCQNAVMDAFAPVHSTTDIEIINTADVRESIRELPGLTEATYHHFGSVQGKNGSQQVSFNRSSADEINMALWVPCWADTTVLSGSVRREKWLRFVRRGVRIVDRTPLAIRERGFDSAMHRFKWVRSAIVIQSNTSIAAARRISASGHVDQAIARRVRLAARYRTIS